MYKITAKELNGSGTWSQVFINQQSATVAYEGLRDTNEKYGKPITVVELTHKDQVLKSFQSPSKFEEI